MENKDDSLNKESKKSIFKDFFSFKNLALNSFIAALYASLTILSGPLAYVGGNLQIRISEILNLFVFFNPSFSIGLTIGCLISNIYSMYGLPDIIFGTLGTLISCIIIIIISKFVKNLLLSSFVPCFINAFLVPLIVYLYDIKLGISVAQYFIYFGWTFLGEFICCVCIGYPLILLLSKKYKGFNKLINATINKKYLF